MPHQTLCEKKFIRYTLDFLEIYIVGSDKKVSDTWSILYIPATVCIRIVV